MSGDNFQLKLDVHTPPEATKIDLYFVLIKQPNEIFFGLNWGKVPAKTLGNFLLPADLNIFEAILLDITIPSGAPPISSSGMYLFAIGGSEPGTLEFISNIATKSFSVE